MTYSTTDAERAQSERAPFRPEPGALGAAMAAVDARRRAERWATEPVGGAQTPQDARARARAAVVLFGSVLLTSGATAAATAAVLGALGRW